VLMKDRPQAGVALHRRERFPPKAQMPITMPDAPGNPGGRFAPGIHCHLQVRLCCIVIVGDS
jgi:hypothetical protein